MGWRGIGRGRDRIWGAGRPLVPGIEGSLCCLKTEEMVEDGKQSLETYHISV